MLMAKIIDIKQWRLHKEAPWYYLHPHQVERMRREFKQDALELEGYIKRLSAEKEGNE